MNDNNYNLLIEVNNHMNKNQSYQVIGIKVLFLYK